ncbi:MAG TPA: DUF3617 family protein [Casimicrobiaceae bacterium]
MFDKLDKLEWPQMIPIVPMAAAVAFAWPEASLAQAKDDLWEVTTKMEMPGMAMAMPAQVNRICISKNPKDEDLIPRRDNCRVLESSRSGNKLTYKMSCTGAEPMTVSGEMTYAGASYEGKMRMMAQSGGQSMAMGQTFTGKRVGDCTATK